MSFKPLHLVWIACSLVLGAAPAARAQVSAVFPYEGYLRSDQQPVSGSYAMRFTLYGSADENLVLTTIERSDEATRSCTAVAACLVDVYAGSFRVLLGRYEDLSSVLGVGNDVFVGVEVRDNAGTWITLSGRQPVLAAPYAMWSASASELRVGGAVTITGNLESAGLLEVEGKTTVDVLDATGDLDMDSLVVTDSLSVGAGLVTDGLVEVSGDAWMPDEVFGTDATGTASAMLRRSGGDYTFNPDAAFGSTTLDAIDNSVTRGGLWDFIVEGRYTIASDITRWRVDDPIVAFKFRNGGTNTGLGTGMSTSDWFCWIGGVRFLNGDLYEGNSTTPMLRAYMYESSGLWRARVDMRDNSSESETHEVLIVCAQRDMVSENQTSWFE